MSVWATILAFDEDEDHCATLRYLKSHVMPEDFHRPGPAFEIAAIPADVEAARNGTDEAAVMDLWLPWLRVSLGQEDAVIDMRQANALRLALGEWLDRQAPRKDGEA